MSNVKIRIRRSMVPGELPQGLLGLGELAVNIPDKKIYVGDGTQNVLLSDYSILGPELTEAIQDVLNTTLVAGDNVNISYADTNNQITISVPDQNIIDLIGQNLTAGQNVQIQTNPLCNTLTNENCDLIVSVPDANIENVVFNYLEAGNNITLIEDTDGNLVISSTGGGTAETWTNTNPTTATDIFGVPAGTTINLGETSIQVLERILYPFTPGTISAFTMSGVTTTYEIGQTSGTPSFSFTLTNKASLSALTLNWTEVGSDSEIPPSGSMSVSMPGAGSNSGTITPSNYGPTGLVGDVDVATNVVTLDPGFTTTNIIPGEDLTKVTGVGTFDAGTTVGTILSSTQFTINKNPTATGKITFNAGGNTFRATQVGAGVNFQMFGTQTDNRYAAAQSTVRSIRWWSRMHWGKSTNQNLTTFMGSTLSGGSNVIVESSSSMGTRSLEFTAVNGYVYIFILSSMSINSFAIGSTDQTSAFSLRGTQTITNSHGASATYKIYRSDNELNGDFTLTVS